MDFLIKLFDQISTLAVQYIWTPITTINVIDVLDILILAALLYVVYRFLRTRRAGRVLLGLLFVLVLCLLVTLIGFPSLSYIVRLFAASAFFCVVVIFQPELRDALERLGNSNLLNPLSNHVSRKQFDMAKHVVEETVDAVGKMSDSKSGALIVFEGLTKLGDYIQTGKPVDAAVTSHLLCNIFYDKAPLHDGALIIRDLRIYAASCVLPSARGKLDFSSVGTRHRAAVGLTEVSDALVVVVSEETGIVSVAQEGKILRNIDRKTLYDILMTYITGKAYLREKRANLRSDYLERLEQAGKVTKREKTSARFNKAVDHGESSYETLIPETPEEGEHLSPSGTSPEADAEDSSSQNL